MKKEIIALSLVFATGAIIIAAISGETQTRKPLNVDQIFPIQQEEIDGVIIPEKFDGGFLEKLECLLAENLASKDQHYSVLIIVPSSRTDDSVSAMHKENVVNFLKPYGAKNVHAAKALSFVTASVPISKIPYIADHDSVFRIGDGEQKSFPQDLAITERLYQDVCGVWHLR